MALQTPYNALKRFIVLVLTAGLFPTWSWGQANLVPNPSFEEFDHCSSSSQGLSWADDWMVPELGFTPDYFNRCSQVSPMSAPSNFFGIQEPVSGDGYMGLVSLESPSMEVRDAITCHLLSSLEEGETYVFKMYVSLSDYSSYQISTVGYKLSQSPLSGPTPIVGYEATYSSTTPLGDKENWMIITDTVVAQGGEQYLTIANFMSDAMSDSVYVGNGTNGNRAYYYIDDVSLVPLDSLLSVHDVGKAEIVSVYPNPAKGQVNIKWGSVNGSSGGMTLKVVDVVGREAMEQTLKQVQGDIPVDVSGWPDGVYVVMLTDGDGNRHTQRLVVRH